MFTSILSSTGGTTAQILLCTLCSIFLGFIVACVYTKTTHQVSGKNFAITMVMLPVLVQSVIMMVNGNLGTSVAILGAFGLVRFRSVPGNSKEIATIFLVMAIGLSCGMGQLVFAALLTVICCIMYIVLPKFDIFNRQSDEKILRIIIPEDLNYADVFDDLFAKYTKSCELVRVKTTNMGSLFELKYKVVIKNDKDTKTLIDKLRTRNGNLKISLEQTDEEAEEL